MSAPRGSITAVGILATESTRYQTVVMCKLCGARWAHNDRAGALTLAASHPRDAHGLAREDPSYRVARMERRRG